MVEWRHTVEKKWATLRFGEVKIETNGKQHVFEIQVYLNGLDPKTVRVELYADGVNGGAPVRQEMKLARQPAAADSGFVYRAQVPSSRPATDYTARVIHIMTAFWFPGRSSHPVAAVILFRMERNETKRTNKKSVAHHSTVCGYRWRLAYQRMGPSRP